MRMYLGQFSTRKQHKTYNYLLEGKKEETNAGKKTTEIDALRRRVTAETLGMGSAGGWVGGWGVR